jgi:hypothetical protein
VCSDEACRAENPDHINPTRAKFCILCGTKLNLPRTPPTPDTPDTPMPGWLEDRPAGATSKAEAAAFTQEFLKLTFDHRTASRSPESSLESVPVDWQAEQPVMLPFPYGANLPPESRPVVCACDGCAHCRHGLAGPYRDETFFAHMDALENFRKLLQFETLILRAATDE